MQSNVLGLFYAHLQGLATRDSDHRCRHQLGWSTTTLYSSLTDGLGKVVYGAVTGSNDDIDSMYHIMDSQPSCPWAPLPRWRKGVMEAGMAMRLPIRS